MVNSSSGSLAQRQIYRAAMQLFADRGDTQVSVTDLAEAAGVARGTIYNNLDDLSGLFDLVAARLAAELNEQLTTVLAACDDPVLRLATGLRLLVRRAHLEPQLGRFICRFGLSATTLRAIWTGQPLADLKAAQAGGRLSFAPTQMAMAVNFISGATLGAILATVEGSKTWSEAGSETAEWVLVALGVPRREARRLAGAALPPLPH